MAIFSFITSLLGPVTKLIDGLHTSTEEKLALKNQLAAIESAVAMKVLDYESKLMEANASAVKAEATGHSWMQRNWRPITMLTFLVLVVLDMFGVLAFRLPSQAWLLLQIGLGGYVIGRSLEKTAPAIAKAISSKS